MPASPPFRRNWKERGCSFFNGEQVNSVREGARGRLLSVCRGFINRGPGFLQGAGGKHLVKDPVQNIQAGGLLDFLLEIGDCDPNRRARYLIMIS